MCVNVYMEECVSYVFSEAVVVAAQAEDEVTGLAVLCVCVCVCKRVHGRVCVPLNGLLAHLEV